MWYAICIIAGLLVGGGGMAIHDQHQPPKTTIQNIYTSQQVQTKQTTVQSSDLSQSTIILQNGQTNFKYAIIRGTGKTNTVVKFVSKTNFSSKTNKN